MEYTDPRTGKVTDTGEYKADLAQLGLSTSDIEALSRLGYAENGVIVARNPNDLFRSVAQVMDVVQNRAAVVGSPYGLGVQGVINAPKQFSPINKLGSWTGLPNAPVPYDTAVSTYAGLQAYGIPNFTDELATNYLNTAKSAYKNYTNKSAPKWGSQMVNETLVGTAPVSHLSGYKRGAPAPAPYDIALPDDYNISLNRDLTVVPDLSYLEQVEDPRGLGMHPNMLTGAPETITQAAIDAGTLEQGLPPDAALDPTFAASAGLGLRGPSAPFTSFYDNIAQAPDMWGGIGALPGKALDAVMAPAKGLYDMFSPPEAPAPVPSAPPSVSPLGMDAAPPTAPDLETPNSMRGFAQAPVGPPGFTDQRLAQAASMLPDGYVSQEAPYPVQPVEQSYIADMPAQTLRDFADEARQRIGAIPDAPAPPEMDIPMFGDERIYAAPEQITPGQMPTQAPETVGPYADRNFFGTETLYDVAPEDFAPNPPGIGLTGTPSMPFPEFAPPPEAPYPVQPVEQQPLAPPVEQQAMLNNFAMAQPPAPSLAGIPAAPPGIPGAPDNFPTPPTAPLDQMALLDNFAMAQPPEAPPTTLGTQNFSLPAPPVDESLRQVGQFGAPPAPFDEAMRVPEQTMFGAAPVQPVDVMGLQNAVPMPPDKPAPPLAMQTMLDNLQMAQPPDAPPVPLGTQNFSLPAPPTPSIPSLTAIDRPQVPPDALGVAPPAPPAPEVPTPTVPATQTIDAAFQAAPQPVQAVPVTPGLPEGPPTTTQLAAAAQMMRDQMAAPPAPPAPEQIAAPAPPTTATTVAAAAPPTPDETQPTPLAGDMALASAIATNKAPVGLTQIAQALESIPDVAPVPPTTTTTTQVAAAPPAPPAPTPPTPSLAAPVGPLPGASADVSPTVQSPSISAGGFQVGQPTFAGGPKAINLAGDTAPKSFGPDYAGGVGVNMLGGIQRPDLTSAVQNFAGAAQSITDGLGSFFGGPPSPPDTLTTDMADLGTSQALGGDGAQPDMSGIADALGGLLGDGDTGFSDTSFSGSDFGDWGGGGTGAGGGFGSDWGGGTSEQDYTGGGFGPDDPDDHGW